eukprot:scaffold391387_cov98-Attheya_sp.AAC.2
MRREREKSPEREREDARLTSSRTQHETSGERERKDTHSRLSARPERERRRTPYGTRRRERKREKTHTRAYRHS